MKVKVTYSCNNPFVNSVADCRRRASANIEDNTPFPEIEEWAKQIIPEGYHLYMIELPDRTYTYDRTGELKKVSDEK